ADEVHALGPGMVPVLAIEAIILGAEAERGDVVGERVEPHVDDVAGMPGKRDAPADFRARHGEVVQPAADERGDLGEPALWSYELRVTLVVLQKRRRVLRQAEEDVLLRLPRRRRAVHGTAL